MSHKKHRINQQLYTHRHVLYLHNKRESVLYAMRFLLLFILTINLGQAFAQKSIRKEIEIVASTIATVNQYKSAGVGYAGVRTEQWERFLFLKENATNEELRFLTEHKNAVVRCYSFRALAERQDTMVFPILLDHLTDSATVSTFQGCIVSWTTVGDFFIQIVTPERISLSAYKLSPIEMEVLDSLLLFEPNIHLAAKSRILYNLKPKTGYYSRIKELATSGNHSNAIIALARYQDSTDIPVIKSFFKSEETEYEAIYAAREFPHPDFYPLLVKIFKREWKDKYYDYAKWRILYQALARYDKQQTLELFEKTIDARNQFRRQTLGKYLMIAIRKYPSPNYEALKSKIKLDTYYKEEIEREMNIEK